MIAWYAHKHRTGIQCVTLSFLSLYKICEQRNLLFFLCDHGDYIFHCEYQIKCAWPRFVFAPASSVCPLLFPLFRDQRKKEGKRAKGKWARDLLLMLCAVLHPYLLNSDNNFIRISVLGFTRPYRSIFLCI